MSHFPLSILLTISIVLANAFAHDALPQASAKRWFTLEGELVKDPHVNNEVKTVVIDLGRCVSENHSLAWGLGSESIEVKGRKGKRCVLRRFKEMEGGYSRSECRVPASIGKISIYKGGNSFYYSLDVSKHCRVIKTGNVVFDQVKP